MNRTLEDIQHERAVLKERFGVSYDKLSSILFEEDPIGINFGHNTDEYDPEVRTILPRLVTCRSPRDVQLVIYEEFCRWFDADGAGPVSRYARVALRVHSELRELLPIAV